MLARLRPRITYANITSTLALFLVLSTGTAYAAGLVTSSGIKNSTILSEDIKGKAGTSAAKAVNGTITTHDIAGQSANAGNGTAYVNGTITQWDVKDGSLVGADIADGTLGAADLGPDSVTAAAVAVGAVGSSEIADGSVAGVDITNSTITDLDIADNTITTFDLARDSVDSDEVLDFGLANQDIGVLYAQVNANGTLASSSGAVTSSRVLVGQYEVDFGRNIAACAFAATQGEAGVGAAPGAVLAVTDRDGNVEAVFVAVRGFDGLLIDRAFQLIVVC